MCYCMLYFHSQLMIMEHTDSEQDENNWNLWIIEIENLFLFHFDIKIM